MRTAVWFTVSVLAATAAHADQFTPSEWPPSYLPSTTHYYQIVNVDACHFVFTWDAARAYAATMYHNGAQGYLATIATPEEVQMVMGYNELRRAGYVGGHKDAQNVWRWVTGPEAGNPLGFVPLSGGASNGDCVRMDGHGDFYAWRCSNTPDCGAPPLTTFLVEFGGAVVDVSPSSFSFVKSLYR